MSTTPTPAALRAAKAIMRESNYPYPDAAVPWALLIDREGLHEAAEALRAIVSATHPMDVSSFDRASLDLARAALARLEATE